MSGFTVTFISRLFSDWSNYIRIPKSCMPEVNDKKITKKDKYKKI